MMSLDLFQKTSQALDSQKIMDKDPTVIRVDKSYCHAA